jgi:1-deoxy-D-xylulose-5-phosphate reductoisomerase
MTGASRPLRVAILGSTGSVGAQALDVISRNPEHLEVAALIAGSPSAALVEQGRRWGVPFLAARETPQEEIAGVVSGSGVDVVLVAGGGAAALLPTLAAIEAGKTIALASKEVLVLGGAMVMAAARRRAVEVRPVDSEHSAIWQCLWGEDPQSVARLWLTASGGPFLRRPAEDLQRATMEEVLDHPRWRMGPKVTVDSATMMNKGLEMIEAHHLFGIALERIDVVIHPRSLVHSFVEFVDGSVKAQLAPADMRLPIALGLAYPTRLPGVVAPLRPDELEPLECEALDPERFPAVGMARRAGLAGGIAPAVLNAANEEAVKGFLEERIPFGQIVPLVARVLGELGSGSADPSLDQLLEADAEARHAARRIIEAPVGVG